MVMFIGFVIIVLRWVWAVFLGNSQDSRRLDRPKDVIIREVIGVLLHGGAWNGHIVCQAPLPVLTAII